MDLSEMYPNGDPFRSARSAGPPTPSTEAADAEQRRLESEHIAARYAEELSKRGARSNFSPEFLATLPKSMAEKLRVTPEEEEEILYHFAATSSIPKTVEASGVSAERVRAIVYSPQAQSAIADYRQSMRISVIDKMKETQYVLLDAIQDPLKLNQASITQVATVLETVSAVHLNLQEAEFTASRASAGFSDPTAIFSGEELEYMALLRRRLEIGSPAALPHEVHNPSEMYMNGHEFVDALGHTVETELLSECAQEILDEYSLTPDNESDDSLPSSFTPADPDSGESGSVGEETLTMEEKTPVVDAPGFAFDSKGKLTLEAYRAFKDADYARSVDE